MRLALSGLLTACVLVAGSASAEQCLKPADKVALQVAALKSQLMVTALTCSQQDRYNDFVHRYQSDLMSHERALQAYFSRTSGRRGQQDHDDYITSLANTQSQAGIKQGTLFCKMNAGVFDEVMALQKGAELSNYAANKPLAQPFELVSCGEPAAATKTAQARSATR